MMGWLCYAFFHDLRCFITASKASAPQHLSRSDHANSTRQPVGPIVRHSRNLLLSVGLTVLGQAKKLTSAEAKDHIGEQATVCGKVASSRYTATTRDKPTFLNLGKAANSSRF